ncbi:alpha-2A adrenergic receptor-like [Frankliniella occidentalis]|uniref:Alpha-2A adrenergic receptor-like n=1 Tax=Frankliniella occidentalis TaxID=133901 RepID=A0A9C6X4T7_FRAOC|nr:alpha-2A adrenergic receptor-like [Frankliniella occidentalis]
MARAKGHTQCWIELPQRWHWRLYITVVFLALFALPALIISTCYTVIVCTIWNKSHGMAGPRRRPRRGAGEGGMQRALMSGPLLKRVKSVPSRWGCTDSAAGTGPAVLDGSLASVPARTGSKGSSRSRGPGSGHRGSHVNSFRTRPFTSAATACSQAGSFHSGPPRDESDCRRASSRGIIPRAKIKTVKMTLVIVFVFVLCWSPYFVLNLLQVYDGIPRTQTNIAVASFVQSLAPLNSAANPLIYCLFSTHICRTLRKVPPFTWVLALRESPAAVPDHNSGATETVTHLGTSPCRRAALHRHHVTIRIAGPRAPSVAISAV